MHEEKEKHPKKKAQLLDERDTLEIIKISEWEEHFVSLFIRMMLPIFLQRSGGDRVVKVVDC
jgi:hypothetical protein